MTFRSSVQLFRPLLFTLLVSSLLLGAVFPNLSHDAVSSDLPTSGPSLAWIDYSGDGALDLAIAGNPENTVSGALTKVYKNVAGAGPSHAVTSIRPESGAPGTLLRIRGTGFSPSPSGNTVTVGGKSATVQNASTNRITATIPSGLDGRAEVVVQTGSSTSTSPTDVSVVRRGKNVFSSLRADLQGSSDGDVAWGDFDGDGDADLAVSGNADGPGAGIYQNEGDGTFTKVDASLPGVFRSSLAWGDYDNDGDLDLAIAGFTGSGGIAQIYRNDGAGSFTPIEAGLEGVGEASLAWGDFDGDGDLDLAVAGENNENEPTARIYRNEGDGVFLPIGAGLTGVRQSALEWVDYDSDGDLDLSVVGRGASFQTVTKIYENDGEGGFTAADLGLGAEPESDLAWGDYQQDGDPDLAVPGTIYRNDGGTFTPIDGPDFRDASIAWGDHDGDGDLDLAVAGESISRSPTARIYRNRGGGTFTPIETGLTGVQRASVDWTDFDGDGDLDLVVGGRYVDESQGGGGVVNITTIYENTAIPGRRSLSVSSVRPSSGLPGTPIRIRGAGFDRSRSGNSVTIGGTSAPIDSVSDNVLYVRVPEGPSGPSALSVSARGASVSASEPFTVLSRGGGPFEQVGAGLPGVSEAALDWGDFDADGDLDLLVAGRSGESNSTIIYRNEGNGAFSPVGAGLGSVAEGPSARWGDYDGDGDLDIALAGNNNGPVTLIYRNDGNGSFTLVKQGLGVRFSSIAWGDYDADGDLDLLVTGMLDTLVPKSKIYRNDGQDRFVTTGGGVPEVGRSAADFGDVDADSDLDAALAGSGVNGNVATVALNQNGTFVSSEEGASGSALAFGDFDADGDLDLAAGAEVYRNDGRGAFTPIGADLAGTGPSGDLAWGDIDADGDLDLLMTGQSGSPTTALYRNNSGSFAQVGAGLVDVDESAVAFGDYDGDGDLDLAVAGKQDRESGFAPVLRIYENKGTPIPVELSSLSATSTGGAVRLIWQTASESGNARFEVQRRHGSRPWTQVQAVPSKAEGGTSSRPLSYQFTDRTVPFEADTLKYRLRQVDLDGSASLSRTVVLPAEPAETRLRPPFPNPVQDQLTLRVSLAPGAKRATLRLYNALGQRVRTLAPIRQSGRHERSVSVRNLPSGRYFLRLQTPSETRLRHITVVR